jgi:cytoskeletal protein CcmA (bactofilin family)
MFNKKAKPYTELLGKTNRIVEGTIIKGDIVSQADFRLDGELIGNFSLLGN